MRPLALLLLSLAPGVAPLLALPSPALAAPQREAAAQQQKAQDPLLPLSQALRAGQHERVPALHARLALRDPKERARAAALLGEALARAGRLKEAQRTLEEAAAQQPASLEVRLALGLLYRKSGQRERERAVWNRFFDDHDAGALDLGNPAVLRHLGVAARYLGSYKDANDTLRESAALARRGRLSAEIARTSLEWAALFLEKYAAGEAEVSIKEALAQDPDDPDAHALYARVKLEQGNDVAGAEKEIDAALRVHPRHPGALSARASILIDNEEYEEALRLCDTLLAQDPTDLAARSLRAAALLLLERQADYAAEKGRVLAQHPLYTEFHRTVAELLVTQHRYDEAVALLKEAVALDPKDAYALSALGSGYLRLGQDPEGLDALRRAWRGDRYNVRTYNLLELFENVIPKNYEVLTLDLEPPGKQAQGKTRAALRLRLPVAEKELLPPLLLPMIRAEWQDLVKRYGFTPKTPVTLELYADPQHYAVRTVGLPGLAALGVTFGQVVTGRSPAQGAFNWGLMIWHEFSHVFAIQLSRSRVPRWFTEGLSEWETARVRKEWRRNNRAELYAALRDGKLPSLAELNAGFTRARDVAHIVVAYQEAAAAMDFLIRRFGFPIVPRALQLFARGQRSAQVLPQVTGLSMAALDQAFRADLKAQLQAYAGTFFVRPSDYSDGEALRAALKAGPAQGPGPGQGPGQATGHARLRGLLALSLLHTEGDLDRAQAEVEQGLKADPASPECLLASAQIAVRRKDRAGAERILHGLISSKERGEGYDARFLLGQLAAARGDVAAATEHLGKAKSFDPDRAEPYIELARLYTKLKREPDALRELCGAAEIEAMDGDLLRDLVKRLHAAGRHADVVRYGEIARFIDPYNGELRAQIGQALLALQRREQAQAELRAALLALPTPEDEEEAAKIKARRAELEALLRKAR
jgi:tetratricopeptide (TPR) repeat protein